MSSPGAVVFLLCLCICLCFAAGDHRKLKAQSFDDTTYVVVIDGGSSGTRLHLYCFNEKMQLKKFRISIFQRKYVFSHKVSPGLSTYEDKPEDAANSLSPLLDMAKSVIPKNPLTSTLVIFGATAGLRLIPTDKADKIIIKIQELLAQSGLNYIPNLVKIITGTDEGINMWMALNYLKLKSGRLYSETIGNIELGGASVQMAYAISNEEDLSEKYGKKVVLGRQQYNIYSYSYLGYGSDAAREKVFEKNPKSSCLPLEYSGTYTQSGKSYKISASDTASEERFAECYEEIKEIFDKSAECEVSDGKCTFNGVWNGGGGEGQKNLVLTTNFFYGAAGFGYISDKSPSGIICPLDIKIAAIEVCQLTYSTVSSRYPNVMKKEFFCMELTYQYALLVHAFELDETQRMNVALNIKYDDAYIEASWALGMAISILPFK